MDKVKVRIVPALYGYKATVLKTMKEGSIDKDKLSARHLKELKEYGYTYSNQYADNVL